jgi:hypothetical protein
MNQLTKYQQHADECRALAGTEGCAEARALMLQQAEYWDIAARRSERFTEADIRQDRTKVVGRLDAKFGYSI